MRIDFSDHRIFNKEESDLHCICNADLIFQCFAND